MVGMLINVVRHVWLGKREGEANRRGSVGTIKKTAGDPGMRNGRGSLAQWPLAGWFTAGIQGCCPSTINFVLSAMDSVCTVCVLRLGQQQLWKIKQG